MSKSQKSKTPIVAISPRVQLCILGNGAGANPTSVAVVTDRETLLFNCGEGVQRLLVEHKVRIGKIKHVLFTSLRPESFAGFFGFLLTVAQNFTETGHRLKVYAPRRKFMAISELYSRFTYHGIKGLKISYKDTEPPLEGMPANVGDNSDNHSSKSGSDSCEELQFISHQSVSHRSQYLENIEELEDEQAEDMDTTKVLTDDVDLKLLSFRIWSAAKRFPHSFAYVFLLKDKPGQLLVEKCKALKVPPGPLFAQLKAGQKITNPDGRTVYPREVLGPAEPGPAFAILECPTLSHTHSLMSNGNLKQYLEGRQLRLIVHIAPTHVFTNQHYVRWLEGFKGVKHIPLNSDNRSEPCLITSSTAQVKLNGVDGQIFRLLSERSPPPLERSWKTEVEEGDHQATFQLRPTVLADCPTMLSYTFRPAQERPFAYSVASSQVQPAKEILQETLEDGDFAAKLAEYHQATKEKDVEASEAMEVDQPASPRAFKPSVLFLGTASATPGKQRNTSAILVNLCPKASMLFDCGEGTFFQLQRFYGAEATKDLLVRLRAIFISHSHADHHFGLVRLLRERENELVERLGKPEQSAPEKPLLIIGPGCIRDFLVEFGMEVVPLEHLDRRYRFMRHEDFLLEREHSVAVVKRQVMEELGLSQLVTVRVPHCRDSHGIVVTIKEGGQKIAYTGDTVFSKAFDQPALDASLLIHEATMNDDLAEEAAEKRHSTISQAIQAGFNCRAKFTMLTHFSQRYAKIAPVDQLKNEGGEDSSSSDDVASQLAKYSQDSVGFAFDFMHLELDQLWRAAKMRPLLETLFSEDIQVMSERREKTALKRKLAAAEAELP